MLPWDRRVHLRILRLRRCRHRRAFRLRNLVCGIPLLRLLVCRCRPVLRAGRTDYFARAAILAEQWLLETEVAVEADASVLIGLVSICSSVSAALFCNCPRSCASERSERAQTVALNLGVVERSPVAARVMLEGARGTDYPRAWPDPMN